MSEQLQNRALDVIELEGSELSSLLQKEFKPKTDEARSEVESAVLKPHSATHCFYTPNGGSN